MRRISYLVVVLCLPLLMGAEVYRWVDEDGVVNYSQTRPRGVESERLITEVGRSSNQQPAENSTSIGRFQDDDGLSAEQQRLLRNLEAEEQIRQRELARVAEGACTRARDMLNQLTARGRARIRDAEGEVRVLPEEERQERIRVAQLEVVENCAS